MSKPRLVSWFTESICLLMTACLGCERSRQPISTWKSELCDDAESVGAAALVWIPLPAHPAPLGPQVLAQPAPLAVLALRLPVQQLALRPALRPALVQPQASAAGAVQLRRVLQAAGANTAIPKLHCHRSLPSPATAATATELVFNASFRIERCAAPHRTNSEVSQLHSTKTKGTADDGRHSKFGHRCKAVPPKKRHAAQPDPLAHQNCACVFLTVACAASTMTSISI